MNRILSLALASLACLAAARADAQTPPLGTEFPLNTYTTSNQFSPSVTMDDTGEFVVVWTSLYQDGDLSGLFGRRFDSAGQPLGAEFPVNSYTTSYQAEPAVAPQPSGFVVVWASRGQDGQFGGIFGRRFDPTGIPLTAEFQVNTYTTSAQYYPAVSAGPTGDFVVVWQSGGQDGSGAGIFGRRFDASGAPLGGEFPVNTHTTGDQRSPAAATDGTGGFVVAWEAYDAQDGDMSGIVARRYDSTGNPTTGEFIVNSSTASYQYAPSVAADATGNFVVVWEGAPTTGYFSDIFARQFDALGAPAAPQFQVSTDTTGVQYRARVAMEPEGKYVIVWQTNQGIGDVRSRRYDFAEGAIGGEFRLSTVTTHPQSSPTVALNGNGNFVVTWGSYGDGSLLGAVGRRGEFAAARGLRVDETAPAAPEALGLNAVLEPGETVVIEPRWRNTLTVPFGLTGSASNFTGPPGPTYTIDDGAADYGTLAENDTADCLGATGDCYAMTVSGARPAQHWDATFTEAVSFPYALAKDWTLHVGESFPDVPPANLFYEFIENLFHNGVTGGCAGDNYCPDASVTRAQMAVFLLKSKLGSGHVPPPATGAVFLDVPAGDPFAPWIEELAGLGVTGGCGNGNYCPASPVTRKQMAAFLLKTLEGSTYAPPPATGVFGDVPQGDLFAPWIEELYARQITGGCNAAPLLYCPDNPNTRGQMAVFLVRTFRLDLYGP